MDTELEGKPMSEDSIPQVQRIAADLRTIADQLDTLAGQDLPLLWPALRFQPEPGAADEQKIAAIDALGQAVLLKAGTLQKMGNGNFHHDVTGHLGRVEFSAYAQVTPPDQRDKDDEIRRLTAELETAKRELAEKVVHP